PRSGGPGEDRRLRRGRPRGVSAAENSPSLQHRDGATFLPRKIVQPSGFLLGRRPRLHPRQVRAGGVRRWSGRMAVRELLERDPREFRAVRESGSREEPENRDLLRRGRWSRSPSMPLAARPTTTLMERRSINRNSLSFLAVFLAFALVAPATAQAQRDDEIIDRVVVRNRKHSVWNTLEIAPSVGISLVNRMTQQYNFQLGIGFN